MADDTEFGLPEPPLPLDAADAEWALGQWQAGYEAEWRARTLDVLRAALVAYDDDPRAAIAVPRLLAAARLAVS